MADEPLINKFSHVKPGDTQYRGEGLRDFFLYRDLGVADATGGRLLVQLVKANNPPDKGTGWHVHEAQFHVVIMLKGWARFMYGDRETLVSAGDCVHQRPGIVHNLFDYSPDMEYIEIVGPANFASIDVEGRAKFPPRLHGTKRLSRRRRLWKTVLRRPGCTDPLLGRRSCAG